MILQALSDYYDRLKDDPQSAIAEYGYSVQKISFEVVLNDDGSLFGVHDARVEDGGRLRPATKVVPHPGGKRTSGISPYFLWDKTAYVFGRDIAEEQTQNQKKISRLRESFEAFCDLHLGLENRVNHPSFSAVCRFLESWNPESAETLVKEWDEVSGANVVFKIRNTTQYIYEIPEVAREWVRTVKESGDSDSKGMCLMTGAVEPLARTHLPIKGVYDPGGQAEKAIVSFNLNAFDSYGQSSDKNSRNFNARISKASAFQYCTALNTLLQSGSQQRIQIGDATTVFWTEQPTAAESFMGMFLGGPATEDEALLSQLNTLLKAIAAGHFPPELGDPDTRFFILGLSPNAARISIRFWHVSTLGDMVKNLRQHFADLAIVQSSDRDPEFPAVWQLLRAIAVRPEDIWRANDIADTKKGAGIPPQLAGALTRSMLMGSPYPDALYMGILRRLRTNQQKTTDRAKAIQRQMLYVRSAILKAWLTRNSRFRSHSLDKEIAKMLDVERSEPAYHMGRLFAALEKSQEDAFRDERGKVTINATIKDRYFSAASATPGSVFPRLIRLSQHHLAKLETAAKIHREKNIQEICEKLNEFPSHLNLRDQGLFAIGYYHQRQDFFKKKSTPEAPSDEE